MRYLLAFYNDIEPDAITQQQLIRYLHYIKTVHEVGNDKSRMAVAAFVFFFKFILPSSPVKPSELYPRKEFKIPAILSEVQFASLYSQTSNQKNRAMIALFYGSGLRLNELRMLKMSDIDSKAFQIKVVAGKGNKDRFTILGKHLLNDLREYYKVYKPETYLFEGQIKGQVMNDRSIQHAIRMSMKEAGLGHLGLSAHSLRHSFATHLLDHGSDIHTIKELLGHSRIETTMVYLHLQQSKRALLVSPFDSFKESKCL
jgi:integrase/recombinase XerD